MRLSFNQVILWICLNIFTIPLFSQQAAPIPGEQPHKSCGMPAMTDLYPELAEEAAEYIQHAIPQLEEQGRLNQLTAAPILTIPVVVHVIHNGEAIGTGANLSVGQIEAQIEILNQDFLATNPNFGESPSQWTSVLGNPEIQFCLASVDDNGFATTGITRHNLAITGTTINNSNIDSSIKPATFWDPTKYYNIWTLSIPGTTAQGGVVGYAYLPTTGIINDNRDGTVVDWNWFGGPGFNQSGHKTLTHETGHYLGLPHTFNGDACNADDNISDTPNIDEATSSKIPNLNCSSGNFPSGPTSCSNEAMYINYMDYVNSDYCYTSFTFGQVAVMRGVLNGNSGVSGYGSRQSLTTNSATACSFSDHDAGIVQVIDPSAGLVCDLNAITPQVTLSNFGTSALTSVKIWYQINTQTPVEFLWENNLATGESVVVSLATYTPPNGSYTFKAYTELPNGETDGQTSNDMVSVETASVLPSDLPLSENFEDTDFDPTTNGLFTFNPTTDDFEWERSTLSAYGNGNGSALFNNYDGANSNNPFGTYDALITPIYDFSGVSNADLTFDVAYARYEDSGQYFTDSLIVLVSTDCGTTYNQQIFLEGGGTLETGTASNQLFVPTNSDWKTVEINLSQFDNMANVSFSFINLSGWGNQLYLDNIQVSQTQTCDLTVTSATTPSLCPDECDASANLSISGGTGNYTIQWDGPSGNQTTPMAINLCPNNYSVTITDTNGCSAIETVTISQAPPLILQVSSTDETIAGANDGTASASSDGSAPELNTYLWNTGATTAAITGLSPNTYSVTMTDVNGCQANKQTTVNEGSVDCSTLDVLLTHTDATCNGQSDGTATATIASSAGAGSSYTYLWSNGFTSATVSNLAAGTYMVTTTDNNSCTAVEEVSIAEPTTILQTVLGTNETAAGANDGTATVYVTGGTPDYTYVWSNNETSQTVIGLIPGEYFVTIFDSKGCIEIGQTMISPASSDCSAISAQSSGVDASCNGMSDGTVLGIAIGGTPPFNYTWSNGQTGSINSGVPAGTYSVTVSDANNCIATTQTTISEPSPLTSNVSSTNESQAGANDGTAFITTNGGTPEYSYSWSTGATTDNINSLSPGIYTVTTTDNNGCIIIENVTVGAGNVDCGSFAATLVVNTNVTCNGFANGNASVVATGGTESYSYLWTNGATTSAVSGLSAGLVFVTVTDNNGCSFIAEKMIEEPSALVTTSTSTDASSPNMADGSATISAMGGTPGYSYSWPTGATASALNNLEAGTYLVTVTDNNNCQNIETIVIGNAMADCLSFAVNLSESNVSCNGINDGQIIANPSGGTAPFTYVWSNGATTATNSNLPVGTYTLLIRDANNCEVEQSGTITEPMVLTSNLSSETGVCGQAGTAAANPTGGLAPYFYQWNTGQATQNINVTATGMYEVTITDIMGCSMIDEVEVTVFPADLGVDYDRIEVTCFGESDGGIDLTVTGGMPPYQFEWNTGATTENLMNIPGGDYSVLVTDNNGCTFLKTIALSSPSLLEIACTVTPELSGNDGTAAATATGGTPPFTYFWSHGQSGSSVDNLAAGLYLVTVTDASGCEDQCLVDVQATTSTEAIESLTNLEVYPNPTDRFLRVKASFSQQENVNIQVLNIIGQEVYRTMATGQEVDVNMDLEKLPVGTYMLLLQTKAGQVVRKVVVN